MKKLMNIFVLVAAAAMALASCQKNEIDGQVKQEVHFTINAGIAETKTIITDNGDGTYTPSWTGDEQLGVLFSAPNAATISDDVVKFDNASEAGETASFQGSTTVTENGTFYSFYPVSAFSRGYAEGDARLDLKNEQKPSATSFDPSCDILVAKPYDYEVVDGQVVVDELYFKRLMSVLRIDLNTDFEDVKNEFVESVSFTAGDIKIVGYARVFLDNPDFTTQNWASSGDEYCTVTAKYDTDIVSVAGADNSVYMVIAPVTIPEGKELTFEIKTENYTISKTVTVPAEMKFAAGNVNKINLTIKEDNCTAKAEDTSDYSGEWLITGVKDEQVYAASAYVSGSNLKSVAISIENGQILEVDGIANCMMTLTKIADGDYAGMYTITDVNGKYLYAASSSGNQLKGETEVSVNAYWTVELQENGTYSIVASKSSNRNVMQFNGSDATNVLFNCYSSASQSPVTLYPYSMVKADTTPRITVEDTEYNVSADDETLEFRYTTKNIDGTPTVSVADGATMTNVDADAEAGIVTVIFDANAEEVEKTATLILSYEGAESVSVTITQAAKAAEEGESGWVSTPFANLKEGDQVVIVSTKNTDTWAMSNDKGTGSAPAGVTGVTYSNDKLTAEPAENIIWYVGVDGNNRIFYKDSSKATWLYCTGTNNGVRVGTNAAKTFTLEDGYLKHIGTSRYVGVYITNPDWRCYTSNTGNSNIAGQTFQFFVKTGEGGGETPVEKTLESIAVSVAKTEYTVGDEFVEPTVTAIYSDGSTEDVTVSAEFTGYNMSAADTYSVTVSYSGKTTTYSITVSAAQGGGEDGGETTGGYTLVTSLSDITTGQYVIAAKVGGTYYAMSNEFASKINGTSVTVTDNAISESDAVNYVVTITKNGTSFSISSGTKYLKYNSGTNLGTQTTAYDWTISEGMNGTFRATSGTSGRGILYRAGSYNQFGGYSLSNATSTSTEYFDIELFKLN